MTFDRDRLKDWYREAMGRRLAELRGFRAGLRDRDPAACDGARAVAQALRGSGATFGFEALSDVAALAESSSDRILLRRIEGLIEHVRRLAAGEEGQDRIGAEWLRLSAEWELDADWAETFDGLEAAWRSVAERNDMEPAGLAERVGELFGLRVADASRPSQAALHLVPEALMRADRVLPLREDSETITVATADPTSLELELELTRVTGRAPAFEVLPPGLLEQALAAVLDDMPAESAPRAAPGAPGRRPVDADGPERVLVVDDEAGARLMARTVLEKGGYDVAEAEDGESAIERLRAQPASLVVADLNMPRLDGLELIWEMRANESWSHIPVIVVTGEMDEVLETKLIEEGADDYIRKPLDPRLFLARVAATIRRAEH